MTKINLVILDTDLNYLNRFINYMNQEYGDKFELSAFSKVEVFLEYLAESRVDIVLAADGIALPREAVSDKIIILKFTEKNIGYEKNTIFKYQKAELLYKEIISAYAEVYGSGIINMSDLDGTKVLAFLAYGTGSGTSTIAAASAMRLAAGGNRVLFLDLQTFSTVDQVLCGEGRMGLSDLLFAIMSKKGDIALKIESTVKVDSSGVFYFSSFRNTMERSEITGERMKELITALRSVGTYDYLIMDLDYSFREDLEEALGSANGIILVSDGKKTSNHKLTTLLGLFKQREKSSKARYLDKVLLLMNQYVPSEYTIPDYQEIRSGGTIPKMKSTNQRSVAEQMMSQPAIREMFNF